MASSEGTKTQDQEVAGLNPGSGSNPPSPTHPPKGSRRSQKRGHCLASQAKLTDIFQFHCIRLSEPIKHNWKKLGPDEFTLTWPLWVTGHTNEVSLSLSNN